MEFKQYPKIKRLGSEETEGILLGNCHIQEKIDGANTSIWLNDKGELQMGSRTQNVTEGSFNGFTEYVRNHEGINKLLKDKPHLRLYGEWLVPHTVHYNEIAYKQFYLFDIEENSEFVDIKFVNKIADEYEINRPHYFGLFVNPTIELLKEMCGQSFIGEKGEGIVIKNHDFVNPFGDHQYAKLVTEKFKEDNGIVFGGNNKHSDSYNELYVVNKYVTLQRVKKIMDKLQPIIDHKLDKSDTPRIAGTVFHDYLSEEIFEIQRKVPSLNFRMLNKLSQRKAIQIYHDILDNFESVAYEKIH